MKKKILIAALIIFSFKSFAQTKINAQEISKHINDSVTICEKVSGGRYFEKPQITLLNLGGTYPSQLFTIVIKGADRDKFKFKPEEELIDKTVCVTGRVTEHAGKSQIVITDPKQLASQE